MAGQIVTMQVSGVTLDTLRLYRTLRGGGLTAREARFFVVGVIAGKTVVGATETLWRIVEEDQ